MKIIFAGTPDFAAHALKALVDQKQHNIALVLTQPDRAAGRGLKLTPSRVKKVALEHHLPLYQPISLKSADAYTILKEIQADVMIVAAYGLILPPAILALPQQGCINIHASLLPRWRGAAPIQRAILANDLETGITIMQMDSGLDTGEILLRRTIPILPDDTTHSLHDRLALCGTEALLATLENLPTYYAQRQPQDTIGVTYAEKWQKSEAKIDWHQPAQTILNQIRAYNPSPGAYSDYQDQTIKLWEADIIQAEGIPGEILHCDRQRIVIACLDKALSIKRLQKAGSKALTTTEFVSGFSLIVGEYFR